MHTIIIDVHIDRYFKTILTGNKLLQDQQSIHHFFSMCAQTDDRKRKIKNLIPQIERIHTKQLEAIEWNWEIGNFHFNIIII